MPLVGLRPRASVKFNPGAGVGRGGGRWASSVLNCNMLMPCVLRPLLSMPATVTLYCNKTSGGSVQRMRKWMWREEGGAACALLACGWHHNVASCERTGSSTIILALTVVLGDKPESMPNVVLLLNSKAGQRGHAACLTVKMYCRTTLIKTLYRVCSAQ